VTPTGFETTRIPSMNIAVKRVLDLLYMDIPRPTEPVISEHFSKSERNQQMRIRYVNGESIADLAKEYDVSDQRVFQIVNHRQK
jgi:hypothetical protein